MWNILTFMFSYLIPGLVILFALYLFIKERYLFSISFRNVFRNPRRSLITITAIAVGVIAIIVFGGYINSQFWGLRESTIRSQTGHFQIYKKGFNEFAVKKPYDYRLVDFKAVTELLQNDPIIGNAIEVIVPEVQFSGLISTGDNSTGFLGRGIDPDSDNIISSFDIMKNGMKLKGDEKGRAVLGAALATTLDAKIGDSLVLLVQTPTVGLNVLDVDIKGTSESFSTDYDKVLVKINITDAWDLMGEEYADKLTILLKKTNELDFVMKRIDQLIEENGLDIEYKTWKDLAQYYYSVVSLYEGIFSFVKWMICILIIIFISNTLFMSVMERVNETGTLRTIGTTKNLIIKSFIIESMIMGLMGGILGVVLAWLTGMGINSMNIPMPAPPGVSKELILSIRFDENTVPSVIFSLKLSLLTALAGSILPAMKSVKMGIAEALRHY